MRSSATRTISLVSASGAGQEHRGGAVLAQGGAGLGLDDVGDAGVVLEQGGGLGEHLLPCALGDAGRRCECTTTWIAELALPPKCSWASSRAATDSEPLACQPAPESSDSTWGAKAPRPTMTQQPHDGGEPGVVGDPDPEAAEGAGSVAEVGVGAGRAAWRRVAVVVMAGLPFGDGRARSGCQTRAGKARAAV